MNLLYPSRLLARGGHPAGMRHTRGSPGGGCKLGAQGWKRAARLGCGLHPRPRPRPGSWGASRGPLHALCLGFLGARGRQSRAAVLLPASKALASRCSRTGRALGERRLLSSLAALCPTYVLRDEHQPVSWGIAPPLPDEDPRVTKLGGRACPWLSARAFSRVAWGGLLVGPRVTLSLWRHLEGDICEMGTVLGRFLRKEPTAPS